MGFILLLFIAVPILEIAVFIKVGGILGLWPTLALVVATAVIGTTLLRQQGLATMRSARESLARGEFPVNEAFAGACLLAAGALLLTPGFVTDLFGTLLLIPIFRAIIRGPIIRWLMSRTTVWGGRDRPGSTIDGEFHEVDPSDQPRRNRGHDLDGPPRDPDNPDEDR